MRKQETDTYQQTPRQGKKAGTIKQAPEICTEGARDKILEEVVVRGNHTVPEPGENMYRKVAEIKGTSIKKRKAQTKDSDGKAEEGYEEKFQTNMKNEQEEVRGE